MGITFSISGMHVADAVNDGEGRHAPGLADGDQRAGPAVDGNRIGLHLEAVMHVRDVAHEHGAAIDLLDGESIDPVDHVGAVVHGEGIVLGCRS